MALHYNNSQHGKPYLEQSYRLSRRRHTLTSHATYFIVLHAAPESAGRIPGSGFAITRHARACGSGSKTPRARQPTPLPPHRRGYLAGHTGGASSHPTPIHPIPAQRDPGSNICHACENEQVANGQPPALAWRVHLAPAGLPPAIRSSPLGPFSPALSSHFFLATLLPPDPAPAPLALPDPPPLWPPPPPGAAGLRLRLLLAEDGAGAEPLTLPSASWC